MDSVLAAKSYASTAAMTNNKADASNFSGNGLTGTGANQASFVDYIGQALGTLNDKINASETKIGDYINTRQNLIDVITNVKETELALQTAITIRDKVIASYEEVMRMPI